MLPVDCKRSMQDRLGEFFYTNELLYGKSLYVFLSRVLMWCTVCLELYKMNFFEGNLAEELIHCPG